LVSAAALMFLGGCASVTVTEGTQVRRLLLPPGLNIVSIRVAGDAPVAIETRGFGVTVARSGAYLGVMQETVVLLPNDDGCRIITMDRAARAAGPGLAKFCSSQGGLK